MRKLQVCITMIALFLGFTIASTAGQKSEERVLKTLSSEAIYVGPMMDDRVLESVLAQRAQSAGGVIDVYNTWTSFQKISINNKGAITGHSYEICQNIDNTVYFGTAVYALDSPITVRLESRLSQGGGTVSCSYDINSVGPWVLQCQTDPDDIPCPSGACFFKVTTTAKVTRGGSGTGKETAWFDLFERCN